MAYPADELPARFLVRFLKPLPDRMRTNRTCVYFDRIVGGNSHEIAPLEGVDKLGPLTTMILAGLPARLFPNSHRTHDLAISPSTPSPSK